MSRLASYTIGFFAALVLSAISFSLVLAHAGSGTMFVVLLLALAFVQLGVQLYFFLHLGLQEEARWNTIMFVITFGTIMLVIVAISWIMYHLNSRMMPDDILKYIKSQSSF